METSTIFMYKSHLSEALNWTFWSIMRISTRSLRFSNACSRKHQNLTVSNHFSSVFHVCSVILYPCLLHDFIFTIWTMWISLYVDIKCCIIIRLIILNSIWCLTLLSQLCLFILYSACLQTFSFYPIIIKKLRMYVCP